jgi:hypothetical protein
MDPDARSQELPCGDGPRTPDTYYHFWPEWWRVMAGLGVLLAIAAVVYIFIRPHFQAHDAGKDLRPNPLAPTMPAPVHEDDLGD